MNTTELFSLQGRTAIVTGATGLLGREHCRALADVGARVVVTDLDAAACDVLAAEIGGGALGHRADVSNPESLEMLLAAVLSITERVDVLVNNAALNDRYEDPATALETCFEHYPLEGWEQALKVNVTGVFLCSQVIGTHMAKAGRGSIVNIASTYGVVAPDQSLYLDPEGRRRFYKSPAYPTSKGAVLAFTRFLAAYWGASGVRVNALSPGGVENGQDDFFVAEYGRRTPLGRMAAPTDYRGALVFLASEASAYMTGANLIVDGGFTAW